MTRMTSVSYTVFIVVLLSSNRDIDRHLSIGRTCSRSYMFCLSVHLMATLSIATIFVVNIIGFIAGVPAAAAARRQFPGVLVRAAIYKLWLFLLNYLYDIIFLAFSLSFCSLCLGLASPNNGNTNLLPATSIPCHLMYDALRIVRTSPLSSFLPHAAPQRRLVDFWLMNWQILMDISMPPTKCRMLLMDSIWNTCRFLSKPATWASSRYRRQSIWAVPHEQPS